MYYNTVARPKTSPEDASFGHAIGQRIEAARTTAGLSQGKLAALTDVSVDTIRSLETGRISNPGLLVTVRLCSALGTRIGDLVTEALTESQLNHEASTKP